MPEYPIIMTGESVRSMLDGRKTQTRRVPSTANSLLDGYRVGGRGALRCIWDGLDWSQAHVALAPLPVWGLGPHWVVPCPSYATDQRVSCLYQPGDRLWVRETWCTLRRHDHAPPRDIPCGAPTWFAADDSVTGTDDVSHGWRSSRYMPRWASRLTLEVVSIRAERVQEISVRDCIAEGINHDADEAEVAMIVVTGDGDDRHKVRFADRWDRVNAKRGYGWNANPAVWAITIKRVRNGE